MEFGINESGHRIRPKKGVKAICQCCKQELIPKCGEIKIHHWAHKYTHCDKWWENETEWHRNWKNQFPEDWREIVKFDAEKNNEKNVCDIYNSNLELVIEFQNSSISKQELESREAFYGKMIWVVNFSNKPISLESIEKGFDKIEHLRREIYYIPYNPVIPINQDDLRIVEEFRDRNTENLVKGATNVLNDLLELFKDIFRKSVDNFINNVPSNKDSIKAGEALRRLTDPIFNKMSNKLTNYINKNETLPDSQKYCGYLKPKKYIWDFAKMPVFIDNGSELLWIINSTVVKKVPMKMFIDKYGCID